MRRLHSGLASLAKAAQCGNGKGEWAMTLRVSGKNMDIGEAFRGHIETRIASTLEKYRVGPALGHVTVEREGSGFRAGCTLHLRWGATVQADSLAHEPYASFNRAADLIENQIRRQRERLQVRHASAPVEGREGEEFPARDAAPAPLHQENAMVPAELHGLHPAVIAEPPRPFREMTVSSAAMELDSTNAQVVVFRHASYGRMNVVYRRPDGNIGWIDPCQE
jgi:ribosomal subunit interface protein